LPSVAADAAEGSGTHKESCYTYGTPQMPSASEIIGVLIVIFVIWVVLKLARVAIRLILFIIGIMLLIGALYYLFMR